MNGKRNWLRRASLRIGLLISISALALGILANIHPPTTRAASYLCYTNHCGYVYNWPGAVRGTLTEMDAETLTCNNNCYNGSTEIGFVSDEQWLVQNSNSQCDNGYCWIEDGYSTFNCLPAGGVPSAGQCFGNNSQTWWFWADNRPNGHYHEWAISQLNCCSIYSNYEIDRTTPTGSTWSVSVAGNQEYSTNNSMNPTNIWIGIELFGNTNSSNKGAYANYVDFINNQYIDSNNNFHYQGYGNPGAGFMPGSGGGQPPYATWVQGPCGTCDGGHMHTWCCESSGPGLLASHTSASNASGVSDGNSSGSPSATATPQGKGPFGIQAVAPRAKLSTPSTPAFTAADVTEYIHNQHGFFRATQTGDLTVSKVMFITNGAARTVLQGESAGLPDNTLVCLVEVQGNVTFNGPSGLFTVHKAFELFDAHSGNFLGAGSL